MRAKPTKSGQKRVLCVLVFSLSAHAVEMDIF